MEEAELEARLRSEIGNRQAVQAFKRQQDDVDKKGLANLEKMRASLKGAILRWPLAPCQNRFRPRMPGGLTSTGLLVGRLK